MKITTYIVLAFLINFRRCVKDYDAEMDAMIEGSLKPQKSNNGSLRTNLRARITKGNLNKELSKAYSQIIGKQLGKNHDLPASDQEYDVNEIDANPSVLTHQELDEAHNLELQTEPSGLDEQTLSHKNELDDGLSHHSSTFEQVDNVDHVDSVDNFDKLSTPHESPLHTDIPESLDNGSQLSHSILGDENEENHSVGSGQEMIDQTDEFNQMLDESQQRSHIAENLEEQSPFAHKPTKDGLEPTENESFDFTGSEQNDKNHETIPQIDGVQLPKTVNNEPIDVEGNPFEEADQDVNENPDDLQDLLTHDEEHVSHPTVEQSNLSHDQPIDDVDTYNEMLENSQNDIDKIDTSTISTPEDMLEDAIQKDEDLHLGDDLNLNDQQDVQSVHDLDHTSQPVDELHDALDNTSEHLDEVHPTIDIDSDPLQKDVDTQMVHENQVHEDQSNLAIRDETNEEIDIPIDDQEVNPENMEDVALLEPSQPLETLDELEENLDTELDPLDTPDTIEEDLDAQSPVMEDLTEDMQIPLREKKSDFADKINRKEMIGMEKSPQSDLDIQDQLEDIDQGDIDSQDIKLAMPGKTAKGVKTDEPYDIEDIEDQESIFKSRKEAAPEDSTIDGEDDEAHHDDLEDQHVSEGDVDSGIGMFKIATSWLLLSVFFGVIC